MWGWGKHHWEQGHGKGRGRQQGDELRIPQNSSTSHAASAGPGWESEGWAPSKEELELLKVNGGKLESQSSQVRGQRNVSPPTAIGFPGVGKDEGGTVGHASPCAHCSYPQLMFSTCLAGALLFDPALQVFPALTSVPLQNTQPLQAWEGWSPSRSLPHLTGPSPLQIENVYLFIFF